MAHYDTTAEEIIAQCGGKVDEFINPKYADEARTVLRSPARLECMMQELPKLLPAHATVGFTQFERWFSFSPVKNAIGDAVAQAAKGATKRGGGGGGGEGSGGGVGAET